MKQKAAYALLFVAIMDIGFRDHYPPEKKYAVTLSVEDWNSAMIAMNNAREIMKKSTLPANIVDAWSDSLVNSQAKMSFQIQAQMRKDGTLPPLSEVEKDLVPIEKDSASKKK